MDTKSLPFDLQAEEALLGALVIDPEAIERIGDISARDFYRGRHELIYQAMLDLRQRGAVAQLVALVTELERTGRLTEIGGTAYLAELVSAAPTSYHAPAYAKRVAHCAMLRRLITATARITAKAYEDPPNMDDLLQLAESELYEVRRQRQSGHILTPNERACFAFDRYKRLQAGERAGIPYGLLALDKWTQGAEPGQLILIAGRPAMGKSSLLQNMAESMAVGGAKVLFASAEMPDTQLTDRFVSAEANITMHQLQQGNYSEETWARISDALGELSEAGWYACDESDMTTAALRGRAIEMRGRYGLDAVFVDYLQILHDKARGNEVERVTGISRELKRLARTLNVPVIAAAQLSRAVEQRENKRPTLADLRESGALEQDADLVAFIYREGYYSRDANDNRAEIIIGKQRNGPAGISSPVFFDKRLMRFRDMEVRHA